MPPQSTAPQRPIAPFSWSRTFFIFIILMTVMVILNPELFRALGEVTAMALGPLFGFGGSYPVLTIFLAATFTTLVSTLARHMFSDWVNLARIQKENAALQKATFQAIRRGNVNKVEKLRKQRMQMSAENMRVQFAPMKSLAVTFLLFILVFSWLSSFVGVLQAEGTQWYAVPWQYQTSMLAAYVFASWLLLYMLFNIFLGQLFTRILKYFSFRRKLQRLPEAAQPS